MLTQKPPATDEFADGKAPPSLRDSLARHLTFSVGKDPITATMRDWFYALAYTTRDRLIERWMETMRSYYRTDAKRVYYLSMEFLMGRALVNSLLNLGLDHEFRDAVREAGLDFDRISEIESDAALGNGGLGRLAACFLDSMATLNLPGYGYGIRYEYGMFLQDIESGQQVEHPENWLRYGNPWEFPRAEVLYQVRFYGRVVQFPDEEGRIRSHWLDTEDVMAMAFDTPIPGYGNGAANNLRLWSAKASRDFDLKYFNEGNYIRSVADKNESENLSKVLYPDDTTEMGRELRLKQQYFFVSASLQDILRRHAKFHSGFDGLPDKVAIQLNDTHPSIAIAELMRILVDVHRLEWERAWDITRRTFAYTNHTLMPEALETWAVALMETVLPRHLQIIYEINYRFLKDVMHQLPGDKAVLTRMSLIDESDGRRVRMAHLAVVGSHKVNGVAEIHTELMKQTIFADFHRLYPRKIVNITNGITPRRWLNQANRELSALISSRIGEDWPRNLEALKGLVPLAGDPEFQAEFAAVKRANKERFASLVLRELNVAIRPDSLFDVQIKRIHEYKRQMMNVLHVITLYNQIRFEREHGRTPRTVIFAGKAAPGYAIAKLIVRLINDVADIVNNDPHTRDSLKVVFMPNYGVSVAENIIPAAELSEQISTAGTEASGTGNMKLALNGALTIGTLDGANIEIRNEVGEGNFFLFGLTTAQVADLRKQGYRPTDFYQQNEALREALDMIDSGFFSPEEPSRYRGIGGSLHRGTDRFLVLADYAAYVACQKEVEKVYADSSEWQRRAILNVANMGKFSSDRTILRYAEEIWGARPVFAPVEDLSAATRGGS